MGPDFWKGVCLVVVVFAIVIWLKALKDGDDDGDAEQ
jgi:hypothetical protein